MVIIIILLSIMIPTVRAEIEAVKTFIQIHRTPNGSILIVNKNSEKNRTFANLLVVTVLLIALLILFLYILSDVPCLMSGQLISTTAVVVSQDSAGQETIAEVRGFRVKDTSSGDVIHILATYTPIRAGEIYEILYLPHTHIGAIIQKVE